MNTLRLEKNIVFFKNNNVGGNCMAKENNRNVDCIEDLIKIRNVKIKIDISKEEQKMYITSAFFAVADKFTHKSDFVIHTNYYDNKVNELLRIFVFEKGKCNSKKKENILKFTNQLIRENECKSDAIIYYRWIIENVDQTQEDNDIMEYISFCIKLGFNYFMLEVKYNDRFFSDSYVNSFLECYKFVLEQLYDDTVTDISFITPKTEKGLAELNHTYKKIDYNNLQSRFFEMIACYKDKIAVQDSVSSLTYCDLDQKSNIIASYIHSITKESGQLYICVLLNRSIDQVATFLGIIKAGFAYIPFEPVHNEMRLEYVLENAQIAMIITKSEYMNAIPGTYTGIVLKLDEIDMSVSGTDVPAALTTRHSYAYANYTSGSTGNPKGVSITHEGVLRLALDRKYLNISSRDTILHSSPTSFDATTFEVWGALLNGGKIVIASKEELLSPNKLQEIISDYCVTGMFITTSLFNKIVDIDVHTFEKLRFIITGGDVASKKRFQAFKEANYNVSLIHAYGPTENTTFSTCYLVEQFDDHYCDIPIGKPLDNSTIYIVDEENHRVPTYVVGQILVGGRGVARGYIGNITLSNEAFSNEIIPEDRIYKTGDYGYFDDDFNVHFCGRLDRQVKIRGFRIELDEIERVAFANDMIKDCSVVVTEVNYEKKLVLYYVSAMNENEVRNYLKNKLANYMIPHYIYKLDEIPLNFNGKKYISKLKKTPLPIKEGQTDSIEDIVYGIWSEVLESNDLDIYKNYFEIGVDSLTLMTVCERLSEKLSNKINIVTLLRYQTIAKLTEYLKKHINSK